MNTLCAMFLDHFYADRLNLELFKDTTVKQ